MRVLFLLVGLATFAALTTHCSHSAPRSVSVDDPKLQVAAEIHLKNVRQLTRDGRVRQVRWSSDGSRIIFEQANANGSGCIQNYSMKSDGTDTRLLSGDLGASQSGTGLPDGERVLFSSAPPENGKCTQGFAANTQFYTVKSDGSDRLAFEPGAPRAYNSEGAVCKDGSVIFTSDREGDLELYRGKLDRFDTVSEVKRITHLDGYDGETSFSPDCKRIVWRTAHSRDEKQATEDHALLKKHDARTQPSEIWGANADGTQAHQITLLGMKSFAPVFLNDGERILFVSDSRLYTIHEDGTRLERLSFSGAFDGFPAASPDGKTLAFTSTRNGMHPEEVNLFLADWTEIAPTPSPTPTPTAAEPSAADRLKTTIEKLSGMESASEARTSEQFAAAGLKPFFADGSFAEKISGHNFAGIWGKGCAKNRAVVVGADARTKAAGIATLLETARLVSAEESGALEAKSCFIFVAFSGGGLGDASASRFLSHLHTLRIHPKALLNLQQVNPLENNRVLISGAGSAKEWLLLIAPTCSSTQLRCELPGESEATGDAEAFVEAGIPAIQISTGGGTGPLNATGGLQLSQTVSALAMAVASPKQVLHFLKAKVTSAPEKSRSSGGAYLGIIPNYAAMTGAGMNAKPEGVPLAGARAGSPAAKAGIKNGDVLVGIEIAKTPTTAAALHTIRTLADFMETLKGLHAGDPITLNVRRSTKTLNLPAQVSLR